MIGRSSITAQVTDEIQTIGRPFNLIIFGRSIEDELYATRSIMIVVAHLYMGAYSNLRLAH
jgi:hypothetical protein